jgi:hypothetical protein
MVRVGSYVWPRTSRTAPASAAISIIAAVATKPPSSVPVCGSFELLGRGEGDGVPDWLNGGFPENVIVTDGLATKVGVSEEAAGVGAAEGFVVRVERTAATPIPTARTPAMRIASALSALDSVASLGSCRKRKLQPCKYN